MRSRSGGFKKVRLGGRRSGFLRAAGFGWAEFPIKREFGELDEVVFAGGAARVGAGAESEFGFGEGVVGEEELPGGGGETGLPFGEIEGHGAGFGFEARGGTGPGPMLGVGNDAGSHRVAFDVAHGGPGVGVVKGAGEEAVLPEVASAGGGGVHVVGVAAVECAKSAGESVDRGGDYDPVDVVRHEAVGQRFHGVGFEAPGGEFEVDVAVGVGQENVLAVDAALGEVVGNAGQDGAGQSRHT